ncbi:MAG TPA: hypothetical protein VGB30_12805 [bacterium]|jgi:hypothetical protein
MLNRILSAFLVLTLFTTLTLTSCTNKKGDPTGPLILIGAFILWGLTEGGWFSDDYDEEDFPPDHYLLLSSVHPEMSLDGTLVSEKDRDWYRTEFLHPGERIRIWSESYVGLRAVLIDENGRYFPSDNYQPGSDFSFEIEADKPISYYVMTMKHENVPDYVQYEIHWKYF